MIKTKFFYNLIGTFGASNKNWIEARSTFQNNKKIGRFFWKNQTQN
jgi:hypothetical protein